MTTQLQKQTILSVINVFETGCIDGKYGTLVIYADGKNGSRQITYGRSQTTEQGNLGALIKAYINNGGKYANEFKPYLPKIGVTSLVNDTQFINLLKQAGNDPVMCRSQDQFFEDLYFKPATKFFDDNGFKLPLSLMVIYDSFIHSGGIPQFLRKRFNEATPASGGDEKAWIKAYVDARQEWLKDHTNAVLRKTVYRTQCLRSQIDAGNWDLGQSIVANGTKIQVKENNMA